MEKRSTGTSKATLAFKGTLLLLILSLLAAAPMPPAAAIRIHLSTNVFHFACTSYSSNLESAFSSECVWTNIRTNSQTVSVTLTWDYVNDTNVIGYHLWMGTIAFQYPTNFDAGPLNNITVFPYPAIPPLRKFIRVSWHGNGTNIWGSYDLGRSWMQLSYPTNSFTLTNPSGAHVYWKATNIVQTNWSAP